MYKKFPLCPPRTHHSLCFSVIRKNLKRKISSFNTGFTKGSATELTEDLRKSDIKGLAKEFDFSSETVVQIIFQIVHYFYNISYMNIHENQGLDYAIIDINCFNIIFIT